MTVREVAFKYAARGADKVQRKDKQVQSQVNQTAKEASKNSSEINRWMERNKTAIGAVAGAAVGAMGAIISASPTARAELAGVRSAFTLFADDVVNDVLPAGTSLVDKAFELQEAYAELSDPVRETISTLLLGAGVFVIFAAGVVAVAKVLGAFIGVIATVVKVAGIVVAAIAGIISIKAILIGAIVALIAAVVGFVAAYILNWRGARDKTNEFVSDIFNAVKEWLGKAWDRATDAVKGISDDIREWLGDAVSRAKDRARDIYNGVKEWLADLRDDALGWGRDLVTNFIDGIKSRLGKLQDVGGELRDAIPFVGVLEDMITEIAKPLKRLTQEIRDYLPSSPARKGPLSDLDRVEGAIPAALNGGLEGGVNNVQQNLRGRVGRTAGGGGGGGSTEIRFEEGAIQIAGTGSTRRDGQRVGEEASEHILNEFESRR